MLAKFCKDAYTHPNKVKLHVVTRKGGRVLPTTMLQEEIQNTKEQEKVRGTVLAAELVGDPNCPSLLAVYALQIGSKRRTLSATTLATARNA